MLSQRLKRLTATPDGKCEMKEQVILTKEQKEAYCRRLTEMLSMIRIRLGMTQEELGRVSGVSRVTISQIESGRSMMNWLHFTALMMVFASDRNVKELLYVKGLLEPVLLLFYQVSLQEPEINVYAEPMEIIR